MSAEALEWAEVPPETALSADQLDRAPLLFRQVVVSQPNLPGAQSPLEAAPPAAALEMLLGREDAPAQRSNPRVSAPAAGHNARSTEGSRNQHARPVRLPFGETDALSAVRQIEGPMTLLMGKLAPRFAADLYGGIIGDDTSGRIPAIILRQVVNSHRTMRGMSRLPLWFLPGGGGRIVDRSAPPALHLRGEVEQRLRAERAAQSQAVFDAHASGLRAMAGTRRLLVVTDTVKSAATMELFARQFRTIGITVDFAALGSDLRESGYQQSAAVLLGSRVFIGYEGLWPPIDGRHDLSGVTKFAMDAVIRDPETRRVVVAARAEARTVAGRLHVRGALIDRSRGRAGAGPLSA